MYGGHTWPERIEMSSFATDAAPEADVADQARRLAPVVWLLGKVQSGKSSIVRALTGAGAAEIGDGLSACTASADIYELPAEAPVIRFLDTRGLGEAAYDSDADLAIAEAASHCTIAVMRAMDTHQEVVFDTLARIRKRHPAWPILIAQTHLHEGYPPGAEHPAPYPYAADGSLSEATRQSVPDDLRRALAHQRSRFGELPGDGALAFVPLDFTLDSDGLTPRLYGLDALHDQLQRIGPDALRAALASTADAKDDGSRDLHRLIVGHAAAASAADLVPVAAAAAVPAVQARLLQALGQRFGETWSKRTALRFAGALGAGFLARYAAGFGIRQLTKLIPVYGQTAGTAAAAATSFATTYALGKAAVYFLANRHRGIADDTVQAVWAEALREAFDIAKLRGLAEASKDTGEP